MLPLLLGGAVAAQMGGSIFSGIMGKSAAKKKEEAARQAMAAQRTEINNDSSYAKGFIHGYNLQAQGYLKPFQQTGVQANQSLSDILSGKVNLDDMVGQSSLFKFQQREGERSINRQLRARGLYSSGAGLETLSRFESQLLGEEGERYMNRLFQLSSSGQNAANVMSSNDMAAGRSLADISMQAGGALANIAGAGNLQIGQAQAEGINAIGGMGQSIGNAVAGGLGSFAQFQMMQPLLQRMAGPQAPPPDGFDEAGMHQEDLGRYIVTDSIMDQQLPRRPILPPTNEYSMGPSGAYSNF